MNKLMTPERVATFAPMIMRHHMEQAAHWAAQWAKLGSLRDREVICRDLKREAEKAIWKFMTEAGLCARK